MTDAEKVRGAIVGDGHLLPHPPDTKCRTCDGLLALGRLKSAARARDEMIAALSFRLKKYEAVAAAAGRARDMLVGCTGRRLGLVIADAWVELDVALSTR